MFDGLGLPKGEVPLYSFAWHPRLVLVPTWQLDAKARLIKRLVDVGLALTALIVLAVTGAARHVGDPFGEHRTGSVSAATHRKTWPALRRAEVSFHVLSTVLRSER